ncbi:MAG: SGNH/GDSL hydrolase family protein [Planctomycetota bacterium]
MTQPAHPPTHTLLFQGDSITDAGRDRDTPTANHLAALGNGYAKRAATTLLHDHPNTFTIYNRGISGHRVRDLIDRWQPDCIDLQPTTLSLLIGVNDMWRTKDAGDTSTPQDFADHLRQLLDQTRTALPDTRVIVCEPFVLRTGKVTDDWFPEFDDRRALCRAVADDFNTDWVPFQSVFNDAIANDNPDPAHWAGDGVHPSVAGHQLMANAWLDVFHQA